MELINCRSSALVLIILIYFNLSLDLVLIYCFLTHFTEKQIAYDLCLSWIEHTALKGFSKISQWRHYCNISHPYCMIFPILCSPTLEIQTRILIVMLMQEAFSTLLHSVWCFHFVRLKVCEMTHMVFIICVVMLLEPECQV